MTESEQPPEHSEEFPPAREKRRFLSGIWILPIIAVLLVGYLAVRSYLEHGPDIAITFKSATGLAVGQTQIRYKSVTLGTVKSIVLKPDLSGVVVHAGMISSARPLLTEHANFWVVRPQLNATNFSDIQALVSGTYIQLEPGAAGGGKRTSFQGLEQPPDARSDEPGRVFLLKTDKLGAISTGSPVFYRDIPVGQVLNADIGDGFGPITIGIFVRDPYAKYVHADSRFWNASGLNVKFAGGLHLEFQSLQSVIAGGIAFETQPAAEEQPEADAHAVFPLYTSKRDADMADGLRFPCVSYFESPVKDLAAGSPVVIYGVYVGEVTDVQLTFDPAQNQSRIRVAFDIKPQLAFGPSATDKDTTARIVKDLLQKGMRATLTSSDLIAGYEVVALEFSPKAEPQPVTNEGDAMLVPGVAGGNITDAIGDIASKLAQIPFDQIGEHLNHLLASADQNFGGAEMKQAVHDLAATLANAKEVSQSANENLTPALKKLPDISNQLQNAIAHANEFMGSVNASYGGDSDFHRDVMHVMDEVNDAARSIRLLADYLDRHPEALLSGKGDATTIMNKDVPKDKPQ